MNPERWVKFGVIGLCGIGAASLGGMALAGYALGGGATTANIDSAPAYAVNRPVADTYADPSYLSVSTAPTSVIVSPPPRDPTPVVYEEPIDTSYPDDLAYADTDVPPPTSILPDDDVSEDAAASGDTARVTAATE